jgi:ADP-ribose pyrophosphatase
MERVASRTVYEGGLLSLRVDDYRYEDGGSAEREVVSHPGAVVVIAHDDEHVYLVRQPREPVGEERLLELPAGTRDVEGESALECARRELMEEVGCTATEWRELKRFYTTPGYSTEEVTLFLATGLERVEHQPDADERIEIVAWPLAELDRAISECTDGESIVGLLILRDLLR